MRCRGIIGAVEMDAGRKRPDKRVPMPGLGPNGVLVVRPVSRGSDDNLHQISCHISFLVSPLSSLRFLQHVSHRRKQKKTTHTHTHTLNLEMQQRLWCRRYACRVPEA
ncbi:hypothetical protein GW17_00056933, partial [Ensete ventricosum]